MTNQLEQYIDMFKKLNRAVVDGYRAPHKPILLLTVIDLIEAGEISTPDIFLDNRLVERFKYNWERYIDGGIDCMNVVVAEGLSLKLDRRYPFKCNIANPFYHMKREAFWTLVKSSNHKEREAYSVKALKDCFECARIDEDLFTLCLDENGRATLRKCLIALI